MADKYTLDACWGDWFYTTTVNNLNGSISASGNKGSERETLDWVLEENGDVIDWEDRGGRWNARLKKIAPTVWKYNRNSGPYLLIYEH